VALEANKALCRGFYEDLFNRGELTTAAAIIAPPAADEAPVPEGARRPTPEGIRRLAARFRAAFPDLRFSIDWQLAEGDMVATHWTFRGTHLGTYATPRATVPPTGRRVTWRGAHTFRLADGRIVQEWLTVDGMSLLEQLGATVTLPAAPTAPAPRGGPEARQASGAPTG
jgi:predicted ester cyclase